MNEYEAEQRRRACEARPHDFKVGDRVHFDFCVLGRGEVDVPAGTGTVVDVQGLIIVVRPDELAVRQDIREIFGPEYGEDYPDNLKDGLVYLHGDWQCEDEFFPVKIEEAS